MTKYTVSYRDEFCVEVEADSELEAIKKSEITEHWKLIGNLHADFIEVKAEDTPVPVRADCGNCGREATVSIGDDHHRCERCANL